MLSARTSASRRCRCFRRRRPALAQRARRGRRPSLSFCVSSWGETPPAVVRCWELSSTGLPAAARVERIAQTVTEQVEGNDGDENGHPRDDHEHGIDGVVAVLNRLREHSPPAWCGRDDPYSQVGKSRLEQDVGGDQERGERKNVV